MSIVVDLIIVAIILLSTFLAYRKGLITLSIQLVAVVISILATLILYKPISNLIINVTSIDETIQNAILEEANDIMSNDENGSNQIVESIQNNMLPETARTISINIIQGAVILILYVGIRIALRFVTALANLVSKLPILNQFNKLGGIIYGILRGLLIVYIALLLINLSGEIEPENQVYTLVEDSYLGKMMNENNVLDILFNNIEAKE
mgnify:CR=1 FL=1